MPDTDQPVTSGRDWFKIARIAVAAAGIAVLLWGVRLLLEYPWSVLVSLGTWLLAAVIIHDGLLSPLIIGIAAAVGRLPPRGRRFVQLAMITAVPVIVVAVPMIALRGSQPPVKALLEQPYGAHLALLLGLIAGASLIGYAIKVARDRDARQAPSSDAP